MSESTVGRLEREFESHFGRFSAVTQGSPFVRYLFVNVDEMQVACVAIHVFDDEEDLEADEAPFLNVEWFRLGLSTERFRALYQDPVLRTDALSSVLIEELADERRIREVVSRAKSDVEAGWRRWSERFVRQLESNPYGFLKAVAGMGKGDLSVGELVRRMARGEEDDDWGLDVSSSGTLHRHSGRFCQAVLGYWPILRHQLIRGLGELPPIPQELALKIDDTRRLFADEMARRVS